jgi:tRNA-splicing ligase RtcB (3'-phosphate/5'-hydroxy nucleic acid ligase)
MGSVTGKDLVALGWPQDRVIGLGLAAAGELERRGVEEPLSVLEAVREDPERALRENPEVLGRLAREWIGASGGDAAPSGLREDPLPYSVWGAASIDDVALKQMETALRLPVSVGGALMPDAHLGYGLPVGGVLATKDAVVPWAVGVDIACRLRLSVFPISPRVLRQDGKELEDALVRHTVFGAGGKLAREDRPEHPILDDPAWEATSFLKGLKDTADAQLGTSGSGNHFAEWGIFEVPGEHPALEGLETGRYLALLTHSGSRGVGFKIANRYSEIAKSKHPKLDRAAADLAWLELSSEEGAEYWLSMELAGRYAAANHAVIHDRLARGIRTDPVFSTEHHHNYSWKERWRGEEVIVHRKGATPAGSGVLGIIPGTMAHPGFVTLGLGNEDSVNSASHGAGRRMSRTQAFKTLDERSWREDLERRGVSLIGGSLDESPRAYKDIDAVMREQADLVEVLGSFQPVLVRMDASKPRHKPRRKRQR